MLGYLVDFQEKVFYDLLNFKIKKIISIAIFKRHHVTFIYSSLSVKHNISVFFNSFCEIQLPSISVFSINVLLIACPKERVTFLFLK